jgi:acetyl-CoA acetyltransferase
MPIVPGEITIAAAAITDVGVFPEKSSVELAEEALSVALRKTTLKRQEIDGYVWNLGAPLGDDYDAVTTALGLAPRYVMQSWTHGRFTGSSLLTAAMAVASGAAEVVACVGGIKGIPHADGEPTAGPSSGFEMFTRPAAQALRRYIEMYGADQAKLADIVTTARRYALLNPHAYLKEGLTPESYQKSPIVVDPLRVADCFPTDQSGRPMNDCGVCVLVTSASRNATTAPVHFVAGQGIQGGAKEVYFGRPGLGDPPASFTPSSRDLAVFNTTGLRPEDMNGFYTYDAFSSVVWYALERFGYCPPGQAPEWATADRLWLDGGLPLNTNGGMLGCGHTSGWAQIVEMVDQLQGQAGPRQISNAEVLQWGTVFGDSVILTNSAAICQRARNAMQ